MLLPMYLFPIQALIVITIKLVSYLCIIHYFLFLNLENNKTIVEFCFQGVKYGNIGL